MFKPAQGFTQHHKSGAGFTLVELLVAVAITAMIGTYTLANYSTFGEDQKLKNAALDIQSLLRQAQASATSNSKCATKYSADWQVQFLADAVTINLNCLEPALQTKKQVELNKISPNITISDITSVGSGCPSALPVIAGFALLSGKIDFGDPRCTSVSITLSNSKVSTTKQIIIEQGGRIYVQ